MLSRAYKLRFRRRFRLQKKQVGELGAQAEQHLENNFFKRLERLIHVRRFVLSWLLLVVMLTGVSIAQNRSLSSYYQTPQPIAGGTYIEGMLGSFSTANPIYATDLVDATVAELVFSGLMTYSENNQLVENLAESLAVNDRGTVYTVRLKPNLTWHDGRPLTAADVVFTYQVIQNPDADSPLFSSWQGVQVAEVDPLTVSFTLPNSLASFPYSLTNGIVPKHLLDGVVMADMRTSLFNTANPVGSGPFMWQAIQVTGGSVDDRQTQVALRAFPGYHAGQPRLSSFVVRSFRNPQTLITAFEKQELHAIAGFDEVPEQLQGEEGLRRYNLPLTAEVMVFFKNSLPPFNDAKVRQAFVRGTNTVNVINSLSYATVPVREPLLRGQLGFNPGFRQSGYDPAAAAGLLDQAGWSVGADGIRSNDGAPLTFQLTTQEGGEYDRVARELQQQWRKIGAEVEVITVPSGATFQSTLANHSYEALLYGISVGVDPDVFVYWHSSQADVLAPIRLNFSEYKSATADASLEAGRTRADPALRAVKYQPFLQAWQSDAPALGLYQPRFLYITRQQVYGLTEHTINSDADRLTNVHNWMIRTNYKTPE
ncbi:MAG: peptide ABC transporter substrate-binding protein [Candidatus Saccharimonadales bacterium]